MAKDRDISPREAAKRLGVRLDSVYGLIWAGKLEAHKFEGRWRVLTSAVEGRLRSREAQRAGTPDR